MGKSSHFDSRLARCRLKIRPTWKQLPFSNLFSVYSDWVNIQKVLLFSTVGQLKVSTHELSLLRAFIMKTFVLAKEHATIIKQSSECGYSVSVFDLNGGNDMREFVERYSNNKKLVRLPRINIVLNYDCKYSKTLLASVNNNLKSFLVTGSWQFQSSSASTNDAFRRLSNG